MLNVGTRSLISVICCVNGCARVCVAVCKMCQVNVSIRMFEVLLEKLAFVVYSNIAGHSCHIFAILSHSHLRTIDDGDNEN